MSRPRNQDVLMLSERSLPDHPSGVRIERGLSRREIGESAGLTRVSIDRQLTAWREHGLIDDGRGFIVVPDMAALRVAVEDSLT